MFLLKNSNLLTLWRDSMNHFHPYILISQLLIYLLHSARECSPLLFGIKISQQKTWTSNIETKMEKVREEKKGEKINQNDSNIFYTFLFLLTFAWLFQVHSFFNHRRRNTLFSSSFKYLHLSSYSFTKNIYLYYQIIYPLQ